MPMRPQRPCGEPGCETLVDKGRCIEHERTDDRRRGTAQERGYDSRWRLRIRGPHLRRYPLCGEKRVDAYLSTASRCARENRVTAATDVHHILGHNGPDDPLFSDRRNLESLCHSCHSTVVNQGDFGR